MKTVLRFKEVMENILLPKYALIVIFVISSTKRIFCNLCDLQGIFCNLCDGFQQRLNRCLPTLVIPWGQQVYLEYFVIF